MACGLWPMPISLDDYFVDRDKTPLDAQGEYDFENIKALNIPLLTQHLLALLQGEEVELPRYNFQTGRSEKSGKRVRLENHQILLLEGIHALNPALTADIDDSCKFKIYASALTPSCWTTTTTSPPPTTACCAASCATTNIAATRPSTPYAAGNRCVRVRKNGFSPIRKMPMPCSTRPCSSSWQPCASKP